MAITGGVKFLDDSKCLEVNGASVTWSGAGTSSQAVANNIIAKTWITNWTSVSSSNGVTETLTIVFPSVSISRLFLINHNWKTYTAKYWNGSAFVDFTGVSGMDGTLSAINETNFADSSSYYEFDAVTTTQIQLSVTNIQAGTGDGSNKYLFNAIVTNELGTFNGFPQIQPTYSRNEHELVALSGLKRVIKQNRYQELVFSFSDYPPAYGSDIDLVLSLVDREAPFLVWPCGGRRGATYFNYALRTWRLSDIFRMQVSGDFNPSYTNTIYTVGSNLDITMKEHV